MGAHHHAGHVRTRSVGKARGRHRAKAPYEWLTPLTATAMSFSLIAPVTAHASTLVSIGATASWSNTPVTGLQRWPSTNTFANDPVTHTEVVEYPASLGFIGMPMEESVNDGAEALYQALASISGRKIIACESQGCLSVTELLMRFQADPATAPATDDLIIVMIGNPATAEGGMSAQNPGGYEPFFRITFPGATPETGYETFNVTREYDFFADRPQDDPNALAVWNNLVSFLVVHPFYADVNMDDPDNLVKVVGNTTYVLIPTKQLPMLQSLYDAAQAWQRLTGQTDLLDEVQALDARLRAIIDENYDRTGYVPQGTLSQETPVEEAGGADEPDLPPVPNTSAGTDDPASAPLPDEETVIPFTAEAEPVADAVETPNFSAPEQETITDEWDAEQPPLEDEDTSLEGNDLEDEDTSKDQAEDDVKDDPDADEKDPSQPHESAADTESTGDSPSSPASPSWPAPSADSDAESHEGNAQ
jgi:diacyltrehalose acyltransferase